jgi:hypothetical protein
MEAIDIQKHGGPAEELIRQLEQGHILWFPQSPLPLSDAHRQTLLNTGQADGNFHKNISYKPASGRLSGLGKAAVGEEERVRTALRHYSQSAITLLQTVLSPYRAAWKADYASFRSIEEEGRDLPWKKRNDLLHTDAFPTRPTNGGLILRVFTNINPTEDRVWVTGNPFTRLAGELALSAGLSEIAARAGRGAEKLKRAGTRALEKLHLPLIDRSPYDQFMLGFHDYLKENAAYQESTAKYRFAFPPDSTWMVFTDVVPHSVLSGRFALEQTMIIARDSLLQPECAPASILEKLCGRKLTD